MTNYLKHEIHLLKFLIAHASLSFAIYPVTCALLVWKVLSQDCTPACVPPAKSMATHGRQAGIYTDTAYLEIICAHLCYLWQNIANKKRDCENSPLLPKLKLL